METKTRLLIADDQRLFAENLKSVIEFRSNDFEVVGIAKDGQEALDLIQTLQPELVLMDIRMPQLNGVEVTKIVHARFPGIGIIVLTTFDDEAYIADAIEAGAIGYILKDIPFDELLASIRAAKAGSIPMSPEVVNKLLKLKQGRPHERSARGHRNNLPTSPGKSPGEESSAPPAWVSTVGRREKDIMRLLARGLDNTTIAAELFISEQTVKNYVYGIYSKIGEHNRVRAAHIIKSNERHLGV